MKYWKDGGEEWSKPWGNSAAQWAGAIFPRIRDCLPAGTILEIAPGFGRWTHYLKDHCDNLWLVEKSEQCFQACQRRFGSDPRIKIYHNDGRSLSMLPDNSVDFVFSFDSLVHVRRGVHRSLSSSTGIEIEDWRKRFLPSFESRRLCEFTAQPPPGLRRQTATEKPGPRLGPSS